MNRDLTFHITVDTDGTAQVTQLQDEIDGTAVSTDRVNNSLSQLAVTQQRNKKPIAELGDAMKIQTANTTELNRTSRTANLTLLRFGQAAGLAPGGVGELSDAIATANEQMANFRKQGMSTTESLVAFGRSMIGPGGIAVTISMLTSVLVVAGPQIYDFFSGIVSGSKDSTDALNEFTEKLSNASTTSLNSFFESFQNSDAEMSAIENLLENLTGVQSAQEAIERSADRTVDAISQTVDLTNQFNTTSSRLEVVYEEIAESRSEVATEQREVNDAVYEELQSRLATLRANELIVEKMKELGIYVSEYERTLARVAEEQQERARIRTNELNDLRRSFFEPVDDFQELDLSFFDKAWAEEEARYERALESFHDRTTNEAIRAAETAGDQITALNIKEREELAGLTDLAIADYEKYEILKTQIQERYANERERIAAQELAVQQQKNEMLISGSLQLAGTLNDLFVGSQNLAAGIAIVDGIAAGISALKAPPGPPWTIPLSASITAQGFLAARQIRNQSLSGSGSGSFSSPSISWRPPSENESNNTNGVLNTKDREFSIKIGEGLDAIYLRGKEQSERRGTDDLGALA